MIAEKERSRAEEEEERGRQLESDARRLREELERQTDSAKRERERGENLQSVLEEFQNGESSHLSLSNVVDGGQEWVLGSKRKKAHLASRSLSSLSAKDVELRSAVSELETHLRNTLTSLQDWKLRAATAEVRLDLLLFLPSSRVLILLLAFSLDSTTLRTTLAGHSR